jgi:two-component system, OmpR family, phosphate regulon sensor histidine kinase PhoR
MPRPLVLFYLLVFYILFQFSWWAYLLLDLNKEIYQHKIEILHHVHNNDAIAIREEKILLDALDKKWAMILGEGAVFLSLLIFGIYQTRKAISHEFRLARQQKNFLLSVTHEFKSPLAAVKLNLQTVLKRDLEKEKRTQLLQRALSENERLHLLVENALLAARLDNKSYEMYNEVTDYSIFVQNIFNEYLTRQDGNHHLSCKIQEDIKVKGDTLALHSMINNLLENAEKYSPEGAIVRLELKSSGEEALLSVFDEGSGIPVNERSRIFQKFYRLGNEDTRRTKGTGLGLYIVSTIVDLHRGRINIRNNTPRGSIFEIYLPLANTN